MKVLMTARVTISAVIDPVRMENGVNCPDRTVHISKEHVPPGHPAHGVPVTMQRDGSVP